MASTSNLVPSSYDTNRKSPRLTSVSDANILALEEQYIEESDLLSSVREATDSVLFIVHRNNVDDVVVFTPTEGADIVSVFKIIDLDNKPHDLIELSTFEKLMAYGK